MFDKEPTGTILKNVPSITVAGGYFMGISWSDWVAILTIIWILIQMGDWLWKKIKLWRDKRVDTE